MNAANEVLDGLASTDEVSDNVNVYNCIHVLLRNIQNQGARTREDYLFYWALHSGRSPRDAYQYHVENSRVRENRKQKKLLEGWEHMLTVAFSGKSDPQINEP